MATRPRSELDRLLRNETFLIAAAVFAATLVAFWPFVSVLPVRWWFAPDTYYAHGAVIPLCAAFIVYDRWPKIKDTPIKAFWPALVLLIPVLYITWVGSLYVKAVVHSSAFIAAALLGVLFLAGLRWALNLATPILYLGFGFPVWDHVIDRFTPQLQRLSSDIAFGMLKLCTLDPFREESNIILLGNYRLDVAEPCSGLKLTIAVVAVTVFFMLIAHLKIRANLILAAVAVPIGILVNGFRIGLIGIVGNRWGEQAAASFHDASGYIGLAVCFGILYGLTRKLGWK